MRSRQRAPHDGQDVEALLRSCDMAMFCAKSRGGHGYEFYADSMQQIAAAKPPAMIVFGMKNTRSSVLNWPKI